MDILSVLSILYEEALISADPEVTYFYQKLLMVISVFPLSYFNKKEPMLV